MNINLCMGCMKEKAGDGICPYCGFDEKSYQVQEHHLPPGTILNGKYLLGKVIGEGGFGITYLGWDLNLELKVAIKEYYPNTLVIRYRGQPHAVGNNLTILSGNSQGDFQKGLAQFIDEARRLAKFQNLPGIVSVKDYFQENCTAYIVMEFAEGKTLKQVLEEKGGRIEFAEMIQMLSPVMSSLEKVHEKGIIHRDISPDNLLVDDEGNVKLLDFGAAREYQGLDQKTLSVILKPGYAPVEQYSSEGKQGPWTDIYALSATIYRAITGQVPLEAFSRATGGRLQPPSELGVRIPRGSEEALIKGLSLAAEQRYRTMQEFSRALFQAGGGADSIQNSEPERKPNDAQKDVSAAQNRSSAQNSDVLPNPMPRREKKDWKLLAIIAAVAVLAIVIFTGRDSGRHEQEPTSGTSKEVVINLPNQPAASGNAASDQSRQQDSQTAEDISGNSSTGNTADPDEAAREEAEKEAAAERAKADAKAKAKAKKEQAEKEFKEQMKFWLNTSFVRSDGLLCQCKILTANKKGVTFQVSCTGPYLVDNTKIAASWVNDNKAEYDNGAYTIGIILHRDTGSFKLYEKGRNSNEVTVAGVYIDEDEADVSTCGMIFPDSNIYAVTSQELDKLTPIECKIARNEIFARCGRRFKSKELQAYYDSCPWYDGVYDGAIFDANTLNLMNEVELENTRSMLEYEKTHGYPYSSDWL